MKLGQMKSDICLTLDELSCEKIPKHRDLSQINVGVLIDETPIYMYVIQNVHLPENSIHCIVLHS